MTTITERGGSPDVGPPRAKRDGAQFGPRSLTQQSPRYGERVVKTVLVGAALLSVLVTVGLVVLVLPQAHVAETVPRPGRGQDEGRPRLPGR